VLDRLEAFDGLAPDAVRRGVRVVEGGKFFLERAKLTLEGVVLRVGDFGKCLDVVEAAVAFDFPPEIFDAPAGVFLP
jgi:hypothetical protein